MTAKIRQIGDSILREISLPVNLTEITHVEFQALVTHMKSVLNGIKAISNENGNALSAPQVGHLKRLILLRIEGEFCPMINPEFKALSQLKFEFAEECFSLYDRRATVSRFQEIEVSYLDENAEPQKKQLSGEFAGLIQHEIDHLDGVLFVDHVAEDQVQSIEETFKSDPEQLARAQAMMAYMVSAA